MKTKNELVNWKVRFADCCEHKFDLADELKELKLAHEAALRLIK